jgi:DNA-binding beta-propeller fold protein YncE
VTKLDETPLPCRNDRVLVFNKQGEELFTFGTSGADDHHLSVPWGICVDPRGYVYVADQANYRVSVWSF